MGLCGQCIKERWLFFALAIVLLLVIICDLIFNWQWGIEIFGNFYPHQKSQDFLALIPLLAWFFINRNIISCKIRSHRQ